MKKNATEVGKNKSRATKELESLLQDNDNKALFDEMKIKTPEQLATHESFTGDKEAVAYKEAHGAAEVLSKADNDLKEKLIALGVNLSEGEFSYAIAEKALAEKMQSLEGELLQEKLKTPEGREKAIKDAVEKFQEKLPETAFSQNKGSKAYKFAIGQEDSNILMESPEGKASFEGLNRAKLIPANMAELEAKYGKEITQAAIRRVYEEKIASDLEKFDQNNGHIAELLKELEKANPGKALAVSAALENFEKTSQEKRRLLDVKRAELKKTNINIETGEFNDSCEDLLDNVSFYTLTLEELKEGLKNPSVFPPEFDWEKLAQQISVRTQQLEAFSEAVLAIETQEDSDNFLRWDTGSKNHRSGDSSSNQIDGTLGRFYEDYLKDSQFDSSRFNLSPALRVNFTGKYGIKEMPKTFGAAKKQLEAQQAELAQLGDKISEKLFLGLEVKLKEAELFQERKAGGIGDYVDLDNLVDKIESAKKDAEILGLEIKRLISELPNEPLTLKGYEIVVVSVDEKNKTLRVEKKNAEATSTEARKALEAHNVTSKPRFLGKEKWEQRQAELEKAWTDAESVVKKKAEEIDDLIDKRKFYISDEGLSVLSELKSIIKDQDTRADSPAELFQGLEAELEKIKAQKVPESVVTLHREYTELLKKVLA